ncbi:MAG: FAD-dependent oxidoreductase [Chlorobiaceae bacterium]|nr:FAD-dependent oxidoreductase [Chlorobiaceae bacterium]
MNHLSLTINGLPVTAASGATILDAATAAGIEIPTLCFNKSLDATGSCWMCIVELKGKNRFVPACDTLVMAGMVVETENEALSSMRRQSIERIIEQHSGDCLGPCELTCPAGCDIPDFIDAIARHDEQSAIKIIKESIPLAGILGRICPAPCEDECRRHGIDNPISICALKRYAADCDSQASDRYVPEVRENSGKKVAIVGSGPAGLTAAFFLRRKGHGVTVLEAGTEAGGMMRYGIPRFRLPESVIESDLATLRDMGIEFRFNSEFGSAVTVESVKHEFDALFLAVGAQKAATMNIPGEETPGVLSGIEFLRNTANTPELQHGQLHPGARVVVTGGGNTAIDAARTAIRLGASSVTILYRRTIKDMPANRAEIDEALSEGVTIVERVAPTRIRSISDILEITAIKMEPGEPDESGRRRPIPVPGSEFTVKADTIISAIGQKIDSAAADAAAIATGSGGELLVDPETLQSETPWIFAGGDCVNGTDLAILAVAQGKRAAHSIDLFLTGKAVVAEKPAFNSSFGARDEAPEAFYQRKSPAERVPLPELVPEERTKSFDEVVTGYTAESAREEALRCLQCRCNAIEDCRLRELASRYLPAQITLQHDHPGFYKAESAEITMEREKCVDCGICVRMIEQLHGTTIDLTIMTKSCPTGALSLPG